MVTLSLQLSELTFFLVSTANNFKSQHLFLFQQQRAGHPFRLVSLLKLHSNFSASHIFLLIPQNIPASPYPAAYHCKSLFRWECLSRPISLQIPITLQVPIPLHITANPYPSRTLQIPIPLHITANPCPAYHCQLLSLCILVAGRMQLEPLQQTGSQTGSRRGWVGTPSTGGTVTATERGKWNVFVTL